MKEAEFQANVVEYLTLRGLIAYHTYDSRRSVAGFPDLVIVGARGTAYRELKTATGRISPDQHFWLDSLRAAGEDVDVWRPEDFPTRVVTLADRLGRVTIPRPVPKIRRRRPA